MKTKLFLQTIRDNSFLLTMLSTYVGTYVCQREIVERKSCFDDYAKHKQKLSAKKSKREKCEVVIAKSRDSVHVILDQFFLELY